MAEKITICSVGDLMICDSPLYASVGVGAKYRFVRKKMIQSCRESFKGADIVIGNFETVVYKPKNKSLSEIQMACPGQVIGDLRKMGFSVLNLANNHCLQHGSEGFESTREACIRNNIAPIGLRNQEPYCMEVNGKKLAFVSLCIHLEWYQPDHILYEDRIRKILEDIRKLREGDPDVVIIVTAHWGDEFAKYPSNAQIALGHKFIDLGANIVLGHHSHVFQGVELYHGAVIAYSQGNFIADMIPEMCRETGIIRIEIGEEGICYSIDSLRIGDDFVPVEALGTWYQDRDSCLTQALAGCFSDDRYWKDISRNHAVGHNAFTKYFKKNIFKYKTSVAAKMLLDFVKRKTKRIVGTSTDGRVSSMDSSIYDAIR